MFTLLIILSIGLFIIANVALLLIRLNLLFKLRVEEDKDFIISYLISYVLTFSFFYFLSRDEDTAILVALFTFPVFYAAGTVVTYLILKKVNKIKQILINLFFVIAIINFILLAIFFSNFKEYTYYAAIKSKKAIDHNSISYCKASIIDRVYAFTRFKKRDALSHLESIIEKCRYDYAVNKNNISACHEIEKCDFSICSGSSKEERCLYEIAINLKDKNICKEISWKVRREECYKLIE